MNKNSKFNANDTSVVVHIFILQLDSTDWIVSLAPNFHMYDRESSAPLSCKLNGKIAGQTYVFQIV